MAAIGPATAEKLLAIGIKADFTPSEYRAEAVVEGLKGKAGPGTRILLARAKEARDVLPDELRKEGASVDIVPAYETILPSHRVKEVEKMLADGTVDIITFTSSSTVTNFARMFPDRDVATLLKDVRVACIGPITAKTAQKMGLSVHIQPEHYTIDALLEAIVSHAEAMKQ